MSREDLENLISRMALRDRKAFDALYAATRVKLFTVIDRVLNDRAEAEETLQEVYIKVWHAADRFRPGGPSPMSWLITIARNRAIDRLRSRQRRAQVPLEGMPDPVDPAATPERSAVAASDAAQLVACLGELPADRAGAVRGAYLNGASYADLARHYDVPLNTMRTWLRRALQSLRECMSR